MNKTKIAYGATIGVSIAAILAAAAMPHYQEKKRIAEQAASGAPDPVNASYKLRSLYNVVEFTPRTDPSIQCVTVISGSSRPTGGIACWGKPGRNGQ